MLLNLLLCTIQDKFLANIDNYCSNYSLKEAVIFRRYFQLNVNAIIFEDFEGFQPNID